MSISSASLLVGAAALTGSCVYLLALLQRLRRQCTDIKDKVVLITGASSGLGEACANAFCAAGAKVILCARRRQQLEKVKEHLIKTHKIPASHEPKVLVLDLSDLQALPNKAREALAIHGAIDILINNGGISYRGEVESTQIGVDVNVMNVNYFGQVALTKAILPDMIKRKYGQIVAVSSIQGKIAIPNRSAYAASKHALQAFFDCLRAEVSHQGIHVSVVSPGYIRTELSRNALTGEGARYGVLDATTAAGMQPEYVAQQVLQAVVHRQKDVILATFVHRLAIYIRTLCPDIFFQLMKLRAAKQRKKTS